MELRRLNEEGIRRMEAFLDSLTTQTTEPYPESLLTDPATSDALEVRIEVERRSFPRRFELAQYLYQRLSGSGLREPERDAGLWAWLALFWFDQLSPAEPDGCRSPGERARWIPRIDSARRYYRHLLLGPYLIYAAHSDHSQRAMCVLCQPLHAPGDVAEQIAARPQLVTSRAIVGTATRLYCDGDGSLRRGAGGKGTGSARRLGDVIMQLDRTFDLHALDESQLFEMLPHEFDRFKGGQSARIWSPAQ
ncbi:MAG: hypothetical protein HBSAPP02_27520 [Phycisphaerae bacterium]|nr:MAG: hypothetical protein HRU71_01330 [Planctomycetia bacterium]GJQ27720.1 MAG: hypothetical protein HBSAPP02_27520 [Phycisphaerae bacterium]